MAKNSTYFGQTYCPSSGVLILYSVQLILVIPKFKKMGKIISIYIYIYIYIYISENAIGSADIVKFVYIHTLASIIRIYHDAWS